jgi:hypothetical protein
MAKGAYIGISGVARKIKKIYAGVGDVARKVKKGYVGIAGLARLFWVVDVLEAVSGISVPTYRNHMGVTTIGNHALLAGGWNGTTFHNVVDALDTSLTHSFPTPLPVAKGNMGASVVGNHALFVGGQNNANQREVSVEAYDASLTQTLLANLSPGESELAGSPVGDFLLLSYNFAKLFVYDTSLTLSYLFPSSSTRYAFAAITLEGFVLFGGGWNASNIVEVYDTSLTQSFSTPLSVARGYLSGATIGNYGLFFGGDAFPSWDTAVDAYDTSLTRTLPAPLMNAGGPSSATSLETYAIYHPNNPSFLLELYDSSLTKSIVDPLPGNGSEIHATSVGKFALFCGFSGGIVKVYTEA